MRPLACLVIVAAFAVPGAATGPKVDGTVKRNRPSIDARQFVFMRPKLVVPPKLLDDETVRAVLFPFAAYAGQVAHRIKEYRLILENGGQGHGRGPCWPILD
jgi:hypothetical protein